MTRPFPTTVLLALIIVLLLIQAVALYWHLYFYIWWLDIPVHMLGGMWVALVILSLYYSSVRAKEKNFSDTFAFFLALFTVLAIGLVWEIYEFGVAQVTGDVDPSVFEAVKDIIDDTIGAMLGALIFTRGGYNRKI